MKREMTVIILLEVVSETDEEWMPDLTVEAVTLVGNLMASLQKSVQSFALSSCV